MDAQRAADLYAENLDLVERIARSLCRRNCCSREEMDDFTQSVHVKLMEDDHAALRKFQGRSKFTTYLTTVVNRHFLDYRIAKWGKWRPSVAARRLGETGRMLDTLISRDRRSVDDAIETLKFNYDVPESRAELRRMADRLPVRYQRRVDGDEGLDKRPGRDSAEDRVVARERARRHGRVYEALRAALGQLADDEWLFIRLKYFEQLSVADIARTLGLEQRPLYTLHDNLKERLGDHMRRHAAIEAEDIRAVLGWDPDPGAGDRPESGSRVRPTQG